jgi:hypothetical protein
MSPWFDEPSPPCRSARGWPSSTATRAWPSSAAHRASSEPSWPSSAASTAVLLGPRAPRRERAAEDLRPSESRRDTPEPFERQRAPAVPVRCWARTRHRVDTLVIIGPGHLHRPKSTPHSPTRRFSTHSLPTGSRRASEHGDGAGREAEGAARQPFKGPRASCSWRSWCPWPPRRWPQPSCRQPSCIVPAKTDLVAAGI